MGVAVYIVIEKADNKLGDGPDLVDGKGLAKAWDALVPIANRLGVKPLDQFVSMGVEELASMIGEEEMQEQGMEIPKEKFFPATEGLMTVEKLISHLKQNKNAIKDAEWCLTDLEAVAENLRYAASKKRGFRIAWEY